MLSARTVHHTLKCICCISSFSPSLSPLFLSPLPPWASWWQTSSHPGRTSGVQECLTNSSSPSACPACILTLDSVCNALCIHCNYHVIHSNLKQLITLGLPCVHAQCSHLTLCMHKHVTHSNFWQLITLACTACMKYTHTWNTLGLYAHAHSNLMFICTGATVWPASTLLFEAGRSVAAGLM